MNKKEKIIGSLLILPLYVLLITILIKINIYEYVSMLFPIFVYLPIIIGLILSIKYKKEKSNVILSIIIIILILLSLYFFLQTYFVKHEGFKALGYFVYWNISTFITRLLTTIFYGKLVGFKKTIPFIILYIILAIFAIFTGYFE